MDKYKMYGAMICITIIELYALSLGIDGIVLSASIGLLSGLGGYSVAKKQETE